MCTFSLVEAAFSSLATVSKLLKVAGQSLESRDQRGAATYRAQMSIPSDPDDCHRPAGLALFAVGVEKVSVAGSTKVGDLDVKGGHAGGAKLIASHGHQIEAKCQVALGSVPGRLGREEK